jgi:hypothetical protein
MSAAVKDLTTWLPPIFAFRAGAIQREMAAEWLKLADDARNPLQRTQTQMK